MVDMNAPLYVYPAEVWDAKKCCKVAKHFARDGLGTKYPWPGYIGSHYGETRYNGGTVIDGEWYQGVFRPLPVVADGFTIIRMLSWGWRLIANEVTQSGKA